MRKPIFEMSANTRLLRQHLAKASVSDVITYKEMSKIISGTVSGATSALHSALRSLLKNERMVFSVIRGVGMKRLADNEIVSASDKDVDGIRRKARRSVMKITAVSDYAGLEPARQLAHTTRLSVFTAIADMTTDRGMKKVEKAATGRSAELPVADTLRAFT